MKSWSWKNFAPNWKTVVEIFQKSPIPGGTVTLTCPYCGRKRKVMGGDLTINLQRLDPYCSLKCSMADTMKMLKRK